MDTKTKFPTATFNHDPDELIRVVLFCPHADQARKELGANKIQFERWQRGNDPVPREVFAFLKLWAREKAPASWGLFAGLYIDKDSGLMQHTAFKHRIRFEDIAALPEYWRLKTLAERQTDTIEKLMMERDFYKENCHRQAKFGLMLNNLFR